MATYDLTSSIPAADKLVDGDILNCSYSGTYKQITLPKGQYKLEVWGSRGGTYNAYYGKGGYSVGTLNLNKDSVIYCYPGGYNGSNGTGFNGGGSTHNYGGGGGGGSDIRIGTDSLYARVIVAGGGGGGGYSSTPGGNGGGLNGSQGGNGSATGGYGGSQTSGGTNNTQGTFGKANSNSSNGGGGGGGWYGGSSGTSAGTDSGGGGGSGYVYTSSTASNYPSGCLLNSTYYLTSASTTAGSASFTSPTGSSETGHNDNGYVRITVIKIETRLEKPYLENLLKYGDFEGEGWTNSSANTLAYDTSIKLFGTKSLKVTSKNSSKVESVFYHNTNPPQVKGHKYYVCCHIYLPTAGVTTQMQAYWPEAEPLMGSMYVDQSKVGQWQRVSVISTRNNWDSGEKRFRFDLEQFQSPNYVYLDGAMLIDLTDCYGEGNEPSKEWCDANIPFFTGMIQREVKQAYVKIGGAWKPAFLSKYTLLEYIQCTGTQYINTMFTPKHTTSVEMTVAFDKISVNSTLWCARTSVDSNTFSTFYIANTGIRTDYNTTKIATGKTFSIGQKVTIKQNKNVLSINGAAVSTHTLTSFNAPYHLTLMASYAGSSIGSLSNYGYYKLYECKIWDNGTLVRHFLPCKRADGIIGLYDNVNNTFYTNSGTGVFGYGEKEGKKDIYIKINEAWKTGQIYAKSQSEWLKSAELITFSIDGTTYIAKKGMTFKEWIDDLGFDSTGITYDSDEYVYSNKLIIEASSSRTIVSGANYSIVCCFIPGTQVLVSLDGKTKNIEDIKPKDIIISYNILTNEFYEAEAQGIIENKYTTDIAEIYLKTGEKLIMNAYHPIYTEDGFKSLTNHEGYETLTENDKIYTINGLSEIDKIIRYESEPIITYNVMCHDFNEYPDDDTNDTFVANGIVVHNAFVPCIS